MYVMGDGQEWEFSDSWEFLMFLLTIIMQMHTTASPPDSEDCPHRKKSIWTEEEELQFMQVLFKRKGDISPGHIFRELVLNDILGQLKVPQKGPKRSIKACTSKWKSLKDIYKLVFKLQNKSGINWDLKTGFTLSEDNFARGWPLWDLIAEMMPSKAKGPYAHWGTGLSGSSVGALSLTHVNKPWTLHACSEATSSAPPWALSISVVGSESAPHHTLSSDATKYKHSSAGQSRKSGMSKKK
ncbi:hypothetical protein BJV74DRAFT_797694 [Russula compacta]|nr:hypothetical protein BJV74DRAFT_797694 [Russula compacta]